MIDVSEYKTEMGKSPYKAYVASVKDKIAKARILKAVERMESGLLKDTRSLGGGLQECKIDVGEGHRIYFYRDGQTLVILLAGSNKKNQDREIANARNYLKDYKRQKSAA